MKQSVSRMPYTPKWEQRGKEFEQVMRNEISNIAVLALDVSSENKHVRSSRQIQGLWRILSVLLGVQKRSRLLYIFFA
jgi:hypothetical protein